MYGLKCTNKIAFFFNIETKQKKILESVTRPKRSVIINRSNPDYKK